MATLLAPADVLAHVDTDLGDPALQRLLDAADAEIVKRYGPHIGPLTEVIEGGEEGLLFLSRPALSITSITELIGTSSTLLAANDYRTWYDGRAVERLESGTNGSCGWGERITVVYEPVDERPIRKAVELELVTLMLHNDGIAQQTAGDYAEVKLPFVPEVDAILSQLSPGLGVA